MKYYQLVTGCPRCKLPNQCVQVEGVTIPCKVCLLEGKDKILDLVDQAKEKGIEAVLKRLGL